MLQGIRDGFRGGHLAALSPCPACRVGVDPLISSSPDSQSAPSNERRWPSPLAVAQTVGRPEEAQRPLG
jgi:hypothetical protein